jgi:hypothetical protein
MKHEHCWAVTPQHVNRTQGVDWWKRLWREATKARKRSLSERRPLINAWTIDYSWSFSGAHELTDNFKPQWVSSSNWYRSILVRRRSWKKHIFDWAHRQKAIDGIYFTKKSRAETLRRGSELGNLKPLLTISIFKCISWLNGLRFWGHWLIVIFRKEGENLYLVVPIMSPLIHSPTFFLSSHLYSIWNSG